jgi:hypothetical protein
MKRCRTEFLDNIERAVAANTEQIPELSFVFDIDCNMMTQRGINFIL